MSTSHSSSLPYTSPLGIRMNALAQSRGLRFAILGLALMTQNLWPHAGLPVALIAIGVLGAPVFSYLAWRLEMDEGRVRLARIRAAALFAFCTLAAVAGVAILKLG